MTPRQLRRICRPRPAARGRAASTHTSGRAHDARPRPGAARRAHARRPGRQQTRSGAAHVAQAVAYREPPPAPAPAEAGRAERVRRCLRRAALLGLLAPWIARALDAHRRLPAVLALADEELVRGASAARARGADRRAARGLRSARRARAGGSRAGLGRSAGTRGLPAALRAAGRRAARRCYLLGDPGAARVLAAERAVAIVGSRRASPYGLEVARALGRELAACGVPVVSGMAFGDGLGRPRGRARGRGPTVAVMPRRRRLRLSARQARPARADRASGLVVVGDAARMRAVPLELPRPQPDHGGLAAMTVVVEGSGRLRLADHGGLRAGPRPRGGSGARPGDVRARRRAERAARRRARGGASAADVLDALYGPGAAAGPPPARPRAPWSPAAAAAGAVEQGAARRTRSPGGAAVGEVLAGLTELELLGLVRARPAAPTSGSA